MITPQNAGEPPRSQGKGHEASQGLLSNVEGERVIVDSPVCVEEERLLALPDALITEIAGNVSVQALGRASCACRRLRDTCDDERLWVSLWKGPLPGGFHVGGKAAHAAMWLLVNGTPEQTRVAVGQPAIGPGGASTNTSTSSRRARRRRVGDAAGDIGGIDCNAGRVESAGDIGASVATGGFPVHVSCLAISGTTIATAAGPAITVWDIEESVPRASINVSGHGSVTCLLLLHGCLLVGDNSGYLRSYDIMTSEGTLLREIHAHADRITAIDVFCPSSSAGEKERRNSSGRTARHQTENRLQVSLDDSEPPPWAQATLPSWGSESFAGAALAPAAPGASSTPMADSNRRRWRQSRAWGLGMVGDTESGAAAAAFGGAPSAATVDNLHGGYAGTWGDIETEEYGAKGNGQGPRGQNRTLSNAARAAIQRASVAAAQTNTAMSGAALGGIDGGSRESARGRGRGRGVETGSIYGTGGVGGLRERTRDGRADAGDGWGNANDRDFRPCEATWLGKRHGYAGRGRGEELFMGGWGNLEGEEGEGRWDLPHAPSTKNERRGTHGGNGQEDMDQNIILFTASDDRTAKAWDAATGRCLRTYSGHNRGVTCLQATHNESYGDILVTGGGDSSVLLWEMSAGVCLETLETGVGVTVHADGHGPRIGCLKAFGNIIVVGEDRHIAVWTLAKGQAPRLKQRSFCEHQRPVRRIEMVGHWLITCSGDYVIRLWDSESGLCVREMETKSGAAITSFRLSGLCLLTTSLFDASVLMTRFSPPSPIQRNHDVQSREEEETQRGKGQAEPAIVLPRRSSFPISHHGQR